MPLGHEDWIEDPRFATNAARLAQPRGAGRRSSRTSSLRGRGREWLEILEAADVPTSPVLELHDAVKTEQVRHNGALRTLPGGAQVAACPVRAVQWDDAPDAPAPRLGADTNEVLNELLGLQGAELAVLAERNVIGVAE